MLIPKQSCSNYKKIRTLGFFKTFLDNFFFPGGSCVLSGLCHYSCWADFSGTKSVKG